MEKHRLEEGIENISQVVSAEELDSFAKQSIEKKTSNKRRNNIIKIVLLFINIITIVFLVASEFSKGSLAEFDIVADLIKANYIWLLGGLGLLFLKILLDVIPMYAMIKKITSEYRFFLALKTVLMGRYGDSVTPMGLGGQPFQIYTLNKYNVPLNEAASIPMSKMILGVITFNITMLFFFIFFPQEGSVWVKTMAYINIFIGSFLPISMLLFVFKPELAQKLMRSLFKLGHKLKLIKDIQKAEEKWLKKLSTLLKSMRYINSHIGLLLIIIIFTSASVICMASVPYFVYRAFGGGTEYNWIFITTSAMYAINASFLIPTPGTSGAAEGMFYAIFASVFMGGILFYSIITWRILTFYLFIVFGIIILLFEYLFRKKEQIDKEDRKRGRLTNAERKEKERIKLIEKAQKLTQTTELTENSSNSDDTNNPSV